MICGRATYSFAILARRHHVLTAQRVLVSMSAVRVIVTAVPTVGTTVTDPRSASTPLGLVLRLGVEASAPDYLMVTHGTLPE